MKSLGFLWLALAFACLSSSVSTGRTMSDQFPVIPATSEIKAISDGTKAIPDQINKFIKPELIRYPMYDYQTGKQWFLSKTEQIVVDAYLETNNVSEACRALNAIRGAHGSTKFYQVETVKRWLLKPHITSYIGEQQEARGIVNYFKTQEDWEAWGLKVQYGKISPTQVQVAVWKERGKAKGWYKESGPSVMNNMQINFTQSDGKS